MPDQPDPVSENCRKPVSQMGTSRIVFLRACCGPRAGGHGMPLLVSAAYSSPGDCAAGNGSFETARQSRRKSAAGGIRRPAAPSETVRPGNF